MLNNDLKEEGILKIKLNNEEYRYDVYQMAKLFFAFTDIEFVDNDNDFNVVINEECVCIKCELDSIHGYNIENREYMYEFKGAVKFKEELRKSLFIYFQKLTHKELPWGTLVGIRPSKRAMKLLETGKNESEIIDYYKETSLTRKDKAQLCIDIAKLEKDFINIDNKMVSVYIGMPFCPTRCLYCSFTSNPIGSCKDLIEPYLEALMCEIERTSEFLNENNFKIETVYFGGGTPTSINNEQFYSVMQKIYECFVQDKGIKEFTLECGRPDSLNVNKLKTMKEFGVHRISINPQTMNDETLKVIGRKHSSEDVIEIFKEARKLGFDNINMDLIVGLPGENLESIKNTCDKIFELSPESFTVHGLSIKRGSKLYENLVNKMKLVIPEQNELNLMYECTVKLAERMEMKPYYMYRQKNMIGNMENVGYCKDGKECIYNMLMIEDTQSIVALGADAVTKVVFPEENRLERVGNNKDIKSYIDNLNKRLEQKFDLLKEVIN